MFPLAAFKRTRDILCKSLLWYASRLTAIWKPIESLLHLNVLKHEAFYSGGSLYFSDQHVKMYECVCVCGRGGDSWAYTVLQSNSLLSPMGQGQLNPGTSCFKCSFMRQMYLWKLIRHHNRFFMKMHYMGGRLVHVNPLPFPSPHPSTNPSQALAVLWVHKTSPY